MLSQYIPLENGQLKLCEMNNAQKVQLANWQNNFLLGTVIFTLSAPHVLSAKISIGIVKLIVMIMLLHF